MYEKLGEDKIKVIELPVGYWTEDFKELLENLIDPGVDKDGKKIPTIVKDYDDMSKDTNVDFTITFIKGKLEELESVKCDHGCNGVEKILKLYTTKSTTNMHLFDANDILRKYEKVSEIIDDYYETRLKLYKDRKEYIINSLEKELILLSNKSKYIKEILDGTIDLRRKTKEQVTQILEEKGYPKINEKEQEQEKEQNTEKEQNKEPGFNYLIKMSMDSVTDEKINMLLKNKENKEIELDIIKNTPIKEMWKSEIIALKELYIEYKVERNKPEKISKVKKTKQIKK
jgi:DNA topoisomerase-2